MPYRATVLPVMIASPGDVSREREFARNAIHDWNYINSATSNVVLMPVGWDTHASPEIGSGTAQELINERILADCDLLVGIFWTRLGTPTGKSASGSVEEIQRHIENGKPAIVYFSSMPASLETVDMNQYSALKDFKAWCEGRGIYHIYENPEDFEKNFSRHLAITIRDNKYLRQILSKELAENDDSVRPKPRIDLSREATELLVEASKDDYGAIMLLRFIGGQLVQANGKTFGREGDRREAAKWEGAIEELVRNKLIIPKGGKGEYFEVTNLGYEYSDLAES